MRFQEWGERKGPGPAVYLGKTVEGDSERPDNQILNFVRV